MKSAAHWRFELVRAIGLAWQNFPQTFITTGFQRAGITVPLDGTEDYKIDVEYQGKKHFPQRSLFTPTVHQLRPGRCKHKQHCRNVSACQLEVVQAPRKSL